MNSFPKCHICVQPFTLKGPVPYLLPCLHAVCETCVTSTAGGVISCSTCQREVNLTEKHLQRDVVRQREIFHLTVKQRPSELLCTHEDDGNQAVCWCQECGKFLCDYCQNMHESFSATKRHGVHDIGDIQPRNVDREEFCRSHERYLLDFWDNSCNMLICARCKLGGHAEHDVQDIDEAAASAMSEIEAQESEVREAEKTHSVLLEATREELRLNDETSDNLEDKIDHTFQSLETLLNQRKKEVLISLNEHKDHAKSKALVIRSIYMRCKMTVTYLQKARRYSSKRDLLNLKKSIEENTQMCLASAALQEKENLSIPLFYAKGVEKLKSVISTFGKITTTIEPISSFTKDEGTQTDSDCLRDMEMIQKQNKEMNSVLEMPLRQQGIYILKHDAMDKSNLLQCLRLVYDSERVNLNKVHIDTNGVLVNRAGKGPTGNTSERFKNYYGTTSTVPLPQTGLPQYLEVQTDVGIDMPLEKRNLVLDVGICVRENRDVNHCIPTRKNCYSLEVSRCLQHDSVCISVWNEDKKVHHLVDSLPNTVGSHTTLHYGVVYDCNRKVIIFLDVKDMKVIAPLNNVYCDKPIWPMFGIYAPGSARISMKLVVGNDIDMTPEKKAMILNALKNI